MGRDQAGSCRNQAQATYEGARGLDPCPAQGVDARTCRSQAHQCIRDSRAAASCCCHQLVRRGSTTRSLGAASSAIQGQIVCKLTSIHVQGSATRGHRAPEIDPRVAPNRRGPNIRVEAPLPRCPRPSECARNHLKGHGIIAKRHSRATDDEDGDEAEAVGFM